MYICTGTIRIGLDKPYRTLNISLFVWIADIISASSFSIASFRYPIVVRAAPDVIGWRTVQIFHHWRISPVAAGMGKLNP
jgi:hypothetical protein